MKIETFIKEPIIYKQQRGKKHPKIYHVVSNVEKNGLNLPRSKTYVTFSVFFGHRFELMYKFYRFLDIGFSLC